MKKIMFLCTAGMSTSMLVNRVEEAANTHGADYKIWACGEAEAKNFYQDVDVVLLGPQVRFLLKKVQGAVPETVKVDIIDTTSYGRMDGEAVFQQIQSLLGA